ncbi:DNA-directed RNA polymerase II subunit RPB1 [Merluccius polli]|uniref:DNA-directed RNA polymerase II subunit RPB1 n=1 Tax=Merluccius polli TaxID=89951 RepID=A0AA47MG76_MERPO|nr:DNA-directed RNA polymerase II subunit RPB1 [Merluccius polli]
MVEGKAGLDVREMFRMMVKVRIRVDFNYHKLMGTLEEFTQVRLGEPIGKKEADKWVSRRDKYVKEWVGEGWVSRDGPYGRGQLKGLMHQLQAGTAQCRAAIDKAGPLRPVRGLEKRIRQLGKWKVVAESYLSTLPDSTNPTCSYPPPSPETPKPRGPMFPDTGTPPLSVSSDLGRPESGEPTPPPYSSSPGDISVPEAPPTTQRPSPSNPTHPSPSNPTYPSPSNPMYPSPSNPMYPSLSNPISPFLYPSPPNPTFPSLCHFPSKPESLNPFRTNPAPPYPSRPRSRPLPPAPTPHTPESSPARP